MAIVWLLLAIDLRDLRRAGPAMLGAFGIGVAATCVSALAAAPRTPLSGSRSFSTSGPIARRPSRTAISGSALTAATAVLSMFFALGLVFDPRYRDFPAATLIGAVAGLVLLTLLTKRGGYALSEKVFAILLAASAVAIVIQERIEN